jgi:hypothetical protein
VTRRLAAALAVAALAAGCGPAKYPVAGRVAYEDGSPLTEGSVVGETTIDGAKVQARGEIAADGTFAWGTTKAGDGARPGKYRVIVVPRALSNAELEQGKVPAVDDKFTARDTSGIELEVKEGKNDFKVTVTRYVPKPADPEKKDPEDKKDPDPKDPAEKKDPEGKKDPDPKKGADPKGEVAPPPKPKPDTPK